MRQIAAVARHNIVLIRHEPGPAISRIVLPVVFVTLLRPLYDKDGGTAQAVAGALVLFSLLGMSLVGWALLTERGWRTFDRMRATPASPAGLVIGKALPVFGLLLVQQAVLLAYGVIVLGLHPANLGLLALAMVVWAVTLMAMGSAVGTVVRSPGELSVAIDIGSVLLTSFAGALVPLSTMPGWARDVAPASPGYWAMRALDGALTGDPHVVLRAAGVMLAIAAAAGAVAAVRIARGWGRSTLL